MSHPFTHTYTICMRTKIGVCGNKRKCHPQPPSSWQAFCLQPWIRATEQTTSTPEKVTNEKATFKLPLRDFVTQHDHPSPGAAFALCACVCWYVCVLQLQTLNCIVLGFFFFCLGNVNTFISVYRATELLFAFCLLLSKNYVYAVNLQTAYQHTVHHPLFPVAQLLSGFPAEFTLQQDVW